MMGRRQDLRSGDEVDAILGRKYHFFRPRKRATIKRALNRRERHEFNARVDDIMRRYPNLLDALDD